MSNLYGEILTPPLLRFDYSSIASQHANPRQGLKIYGPYDQNLLGKTNIRFAVIAAPGVQNPKDALVNGLCNGTGPFQGFKNLFRVPLLLQKERVISIESESEVRNAAQKIAKDGDVDLVFIITSSHREDLYRVGKLELLGNGIPSQFVEGEKLSDPNQAPWILENIALASYSKIGGTPWVVASRSNKRELVIGVSRAQDKAKRYVVGFVTLFTQDGDFLILHSIAPVLEWEQEKYVGGLSCLIVEAFEEYKRNQGDPEAIVFHFCKRPGRFREVEAAQQALQKLKVSIPYALLHLNNDASYRLFDASHRTYVPQSGLKVNMSQHCALLLLDGRVNGERRRRGIPNVLEISLDKRSTISVDEFPSLVRQIYDFARVNWRGFNAQAVPVTLNYSYLIARLIVELGANNWSVIISSGRLRDKAWFL